MQVSVSLFTQNHLDWDRFDRRATDEAPPVSDRQIYEEELALAEQVEPLGYDSIWAVEHHFSPLNLTPSPFTFLAYLAGRTRRLDFGTMVIVLPWHDPLRVAEEIAIFDQLLGGRTLTVGLGRGAARREFDPRGIPMGESRGRFLEGLEIVRRALTQERFSFQGQHYAVAETSLRPRPRSADLVARMRVAGNSPETIPMAAREGLGLLLLNHKPWPEYVADVERFNGLRADAGFPPSQPIVVVNVVCAESDAQGWEELQRYFGAMKDGTNRHYEWDDAEHFRQAGGYDHYAKAAEQRKATPRAQALDASSRTQVYGSPDQCFRQLLHIREMTYASEFIFVFKYGGMPYAVAERSLRLFAQEVLPRLHKLPAERPSEVPAALALR